MKMLLEVRIKQRVKDQPSAEEHEKVSMNVCVVIHFVFHVSMREYVCTYISMNFSVVIHFAFHVLVCVDMNAKFDWVVNAWVGSFEVFIFVCEYVIMCE
jgi:hypothetical protein